LLPTEAFQPRPGLILKLKRAHMACVGVGGPVAGCAVEVRDDAPMHAED